MTAYGSIDIAVEAMKYGANDFLCKPFEPQLLIGVIKDIIQHKEVVDRSGSGRSKGDRRFLTESSSRKNTSTD